MERPVYAHSLPNRPESDWESMAEHEEGVAALCRRFLERIDPSLSPWGELLGRWHDLGKYSDAFQHYLLGAGAPDSHAAEIRGTVDHSTAGAQYAEERLGSAGRLVAYCIAGHHAGLPDWESGRSGLRQRLEKETEPIDAAPMGLLDFDHLSLPAFEWDRNASRLAFQVAFFTRMLFSCLVDADFLATERFMDEARADQRPSENPRPSDLLDSLDAYLAHLERDSEDTFVNRRRNEVLAACRAKATRSPGLFSLNVPTGGGKTFSSLAFALSHAKAHGLHRVVYAIPFTSIVEQTVDTFRKAMGDLRHTVLEHHSNVDVDDPSRQTVRSRLATENWDATLIVTTNVQLFESLFASKPSRCRKLHRLAKSVIVLDEAQTLPPELLAPTLAAIEELCRNFGSTVVLCTATQPAIERREGFPIGLDKVTPIVDRPRELHNALQRTRIEVHGTLETNELAERLACEPQVLCIVNSRRHAAELFRQVVHRSNADDCLHLSANMCAAHRAEVVAEIRRRLDPTVNEPCRVVSTQVIEAGVDVDFPAVYRAAAGLDSIAQAAGRCNREGRRKNGRVLVFESDEKAHRAPPFIRRAAETAREVIPDHADNLLSPEAVEAFFRLHYWQQGGDGGRGWDRGRGEGRPSVLDCFRAKGLECQFRAAAERYRLIEDSQTTILVPWSARGQALRRELEQMPDMPEAKHLRVWDRRAQRYVVSVFDHGLRTLVENQVLFERQGRYYLANDNSYDWHLGFTFEAVGLDPEMLIQ